MVRKKPFKILSFFSDHLLVLNETNINNFIIKVLSKYSFPIERDCNNCLTNIAVKC